MLDLVLSVHASDSYVPAHMWLHAAPEDFNRAELAATYYNGNR